ncbi:hypothetical protein ACQ86N_03535 [Puia sp. P3]
MKASSELLPNFRCQPMRALNSWSSVLAVESLRFGGIVDEIWV